MIAKWGTLNRTDYIEVYYMDSHHKYHTLGWAYNERQLRRYTKWAKKAVAKEHEQELRIALLWDKTEA